MKTPKNPNFATAIANLFTTDDLHQDIQNLPHELQQIFDMLLDTDYGNELQTRRKMLRIKEVSSQLAQTIAPFSEAEIQDSCKYH